MLSLPQQQLFLVSSIRRAIFLQAHKVVMAACSDYFLTAICGSKSNGSESASDADNNMIVELQYVTMRGFAPLLEYAYTSELNVKASDIIDVLAAASYMQMIDVSERKLAKYFHVDELAANKIIMQNFKLLFNICTNLISSKINDAKL